MAKILPMIRNAARVSRPGLAVGILRVLCNGKCTAKRSTLITKNTHAEWDAPVSQIVSLSLQQVPSPLSYPCHNLEERWDPSSWKPSLPRSSHSDPTWMAPT